MSSKMRRARDLDLLDAVDAFKRDPFSRPVWRIAREGRDPILGAASISRWCNGAFDVLYTSLERDGALAEIHALLSLEPVFPSRIKSFVHKLAVDVRQTLHLADISTLERLGVNVERYRDRDYTKTQGIADAAFFLGFDGLVAPSARWDCLNAMLFTDRISPDGVIITETEKEPVDWRIWRAAKRG